MKVHIRSFIESLNDSIVRDSLDQQKSEIERRLSSSNIWEDSKVASELALKLSNIEARLAELKELDEALLEVEELYQMAIDENEGAVVEDCIEKMAELEKEVSERELRSFLNEPHDKLSCYIQIVAGAGGTESCDWVSMLYNMYSQWAPRQEFIISLVDERPNDEAGAGYRSITARLSGEMAYGWMKAEAGVHRLVRVSPFDPQRKRHTSFAQVLVYPDLPPEDSFHNDINAKDLRIDTYRASGAGGQHVNKTDSAVRITHLPSGVVVSCQSERSQHQNKATAMSMLRSRLRQIDKEKEYRQRVDNTIGVGDNSWGNQIRSIVLQPYQIVKDHRTGWETGNVASFLSGEELNPAMISYLRWTAKQATSRS
jgi:peptide chain release factor 2